MLLSDLSRIVTRKRNGRARRHEKDGLPIGDWPELRLAHSDLRAHLSFLPQALERARSDADCFVSAHDLFSVQSSLTHSLETPASMRANHDAERDDDLEDAVAGARADEEAQLLPHEEFEFEDSDTSTPQYVPQPKRTWHWLYGPQPARPQRIKPLLRSVQQSPARFLDRILPENKHKRALLAVYVLLWAVGLMLFLRAQLPIKDGEGRDVINLDCVDTLWRRKNECGLGGIDCRPFSNDTFAFRCPANCAGVQILNPHAVGPKDYNYRPFVIGGGDQTYRGDSFICGSAIHAGVVSDARGGCGRVTRLGELVGYSSTKKNGIESIPFDSYFPLAFRVSKDTNDRRVQCNGDPRNAMLFYSLVFTALLCVFSNSPLLFFPIFTMIFAQVSFASDPPSASYRNISVIPDHISMFAKRLLPAFFCAVVLYWTTIKRTLSGLEAPFEKTILWLGGFWFGALENYTFEWMPLNRLNADDLQQQPGAKLALAIILIILTCIIASQVYFFWLEGRLPRYLALYGLFLFGILVCLLIPGVSLRIHHYIIGLLLLPGTGMQTRPALLYQGILLGLFANGIARWDFDSILQTADALRRDGTFDSPMPNITGVEVFRNPNDITAAFSFAVPPAGMHGISALVNDVERFRDFFTDGLERNITWIRDGGLGLPEYFRFAYVKAGRTLDYVNVGALNAQGHWESKAID